MDVVLLVELNEDERARELLWLFPLEVLESTLG
jgi:hypothetical protein